MNCPGIAAISEAGRKKRKAIRQYCQQKHIDILALQETHTTGELSSLSSFFPFSTYCSHTSPSIGGVAFIIFNPKVKVCGKTDAQDGMMYSIKIEYLERKFTIVNFYSPPNRVTQQKLFDQHLGLWDNTAPILFMGDWNFLEDPVKDSVGSKNPHLTPPISLEHLKDIHQLVDVTEIHNSITQMTRWNVDFSSGARLDRIYASDCMKHCFLAVHNEAIPCILSSSVRDTVSDYNIMIVTSSATTAPRGEGYWKLNTQVLKSTALQQQLLAIMETHILQPSKKHSKFAQYELLKGQIKMTLLDWSIDRARKIKEKVAILKKHITEVILKTKYTKKMKNIG